ncbi:response regulator [Corallococcus sp. H22C18031201]|nr:response regulator [Corallococcus sp. H22C18031201]
MEESKVLVVDDEPQVAHALRRLLRREGFTVEVAYNGEEALERLQQFTPDIVLSDFRMPGMTGSELLQQVKRSHPLALRLIISGYADFKSVVASVNDGEICRFISKPWDDAELVAYLLGLLRHREVMAQLYQPFLGERTGRTAEACPADSALVVKVQLTEPAFATDQAMKLIERFAGLLADDSLKVVGGLLERYGGKVSFVAEVGGPQRLKVELPVRTELAPTAARSLVGKA